MLIYFSNFLFYDVFDIKFRLLKESVIPDNTDDEIWINQIKLNVFRNVQINVIGDAYHCDPGINFYN